MSRPLVDLRNEKWSDGLKRMFGQYVLKELPAGSVRLFAGCPDAHIPLFHLNDPPVNNSLPKVMGCEMS